MTQHQTFAESANAVYSMMGSPLLRHLILIGSFVTFVHCAATVVQKVNYEDKYVEHFGSKIRNTGIVS